MLKETKRYILMKTFTWVPPDRIYPVIIVTTHALNLFSFATRWRMQVFSCFEITSVLKTYTFFVNYTVII